MFSHLMCVIASSRWSKIHAAGFKQTWDVFALKQIQAALVLALNLFSTTNNNWCCMLAKGERRQLHTCNRFIMRGWWWMLGGGALCWKQKLMNVLQTNFPTEQNLAQQWFCSHIAQHQILKVEHGSLRLSPSFLLSRRLFRILEQALRN